MDHMRIRRLMGQMSGLEDSYLKLSEEELLEGDSMHIGYVGIIDQLMISNEHRLNKELQTLRVEKSKLDSVMADIEEIRKRIGI